MIKKLAFILTIFAMVACADNKPTEVYDLSQADPNNKSEIGDNNGFVDKDNTKYDNFLIDYQDINGTDPVVVAFGEKKQNLVLVYVNDGELRYKSSANSGLTFTLEKAVGSGSGKIASPVVFTSGNKITVAASAEGTFGYEYNFPVSPNANQQSRVLTIQGTFNPDNGDIEWESAWKELAGVQSYINGTLGGFFKQFSTFTGVGKGGEGSPLILPIATANIMTSVSKFGIVLAYSQDGKNWRFGNAVAPNENNWNNLDETRQISRYLQTKVFKVNGNNVELLARPRWKGSPRGFGIINLNKEINYNNKTYNVSSSIGKDAQSVFETIITDTHTYLINGQGDDSDIKLGKYTGSTLQNLEREVTVSQTGRAASVAILGDGSIATFVNENYQYLVDPEKVQLTGKLVYKRFTQKYLETHDVIGTEVAR